MIKEVEKGDRKKSDIAAAFGIPRSTLSTIMKNKVKFQSYASEGMSSNKFRIKRAEFPDVEKCLLKWFKEARDRSIPLSGHMLQKKALQFAQSLGRKDFQASTDWIWNFKKRYDIVGKSICGESSSIDEDVCMKWTDELPTLISSFKPEEIYNADETGLFYKCLPNKTMEFRNKPCHGGKASKERLTVLLTSNMTGSDKRVPLVIGKSKKPRCFKNVRRFPTTYATNKKAWATSELFT